MVIKKPTVLTVCYPIVNNRILLGKKKRNIKARHYVYGVGLFNGFGGHQESDETIIQTAKRELEDESGLIATELTKVGVVLIVYKDSDKMIELHFFTTKTFKGVVKESNEMRPVWCNIDRLPLSEMWPNDSYYMDMIITNQKFIGYFILNNPDDKKILSYNVKQIKTLPEHLNHVRYLRSLNL
ncbi:MAG: 8-oxo-dGTP diphosphatase [Candidatus Kerfeldbacteria bacterium]